MPAARGPTAPSTELLIGTRAPRIVVVDDEPSILEMMRLRLESMGATVITVLRGADAVPVVRAQSPDILLLDIMMPDMDGFAVIRALKEDEVTRQIPVIFMTARDEVDSRVLGLDLGAHDYVTKPFNTIELVARIRAALRVKALQDELTEKTKMLEQLATRYGGEEFVWLLPGANQQAAIELGDWLLRTISEMEVVTTPVSLRVTVSIGVSTYEPDAHGAVPTTALRQPADEALLAAKRTGKDRGGF